MCVIDDDERCELWTESHRKARKVHKCGCCEGQIQPGDVYLLHYSRFDGYENDNSKMCPPCEEARKQFADAHEHHTPSPSFFREVLQGCVYGNDEASEKIWKPMLAAMHDRAAAVPGTRAGRK